MSLQTPGGDIDEVAWIKEYMDLSGMTESQARSVFMYVGCKETPRTEDIGTPVKFFSDVPTEYHPGSFN